MEKNEIKINRIIIFTLESLYSSQAITKLVERYKDKVVLICVSKRYGGKYGSFFHQLKKNFIRSGFNFVNYLSFHLIYYKPFVYLTDFINKLLGHRKKNYTIRQLSKKYKIPVIRTKEINNSQTIRSIKDAQPDLIISAYFDQVIRQSIINLPKFGIINIHTAPLPDFKGPFPPLWPALLGFREGGVTLHYVDNEELDSGPILKQKKILISNKDSILSLDVKLMSLGADLLVEVIKEIENNTIKPSVQCGGHYYSFPTREDLKKLKNKNIKLYTFREFIIFFI